MDNTPPAQSASIFEATFMLLVLMVVIPVLRLLDFVFRDRRAEQTTGAPNR